MSQERIWLAVIVVVLGAGAVRVEAQESVASKVKADEPEKALTAFRLDFALSEFDDGKKVNTRHYSMNLVPGYTPTNEIKIGSRVPVEGKQGEMQYIDVGTNIWSRMTDQHSTLQLEVRADLTNFANPETGEPEFDAAAAGASHQREHSGHAWEAYSGRGGR